MTDTLEEAQTCAEESLRQSVGHEFAQDAKLARDMLQELSRPKRLLQAEDVRPLVEHILNAATITCDQEMGEEHGSVQEGVQAVLKRLGPLNGQWSTSYVPIVAHFMTYRCPESVFTIITRVLERDPKIHEHWLFASLYLAAHSDGVMRRDAARFLALTILGALDVAGIRDAYRSGILESSAAASDEMSQLDGIPREELRRIRQS